MDAFKEIIAPFGGVILSTGLAFGPFAQVMKCRRDKDLGSTNPDLFPMLWGNCIGWGLYATAVGNHFVFLSNVCGVVLGCLYVMTAYHLASSEALRTKIERLSLAVLSFWTLFGYYASTLPAGSRNSCLGLAANAMCLILLASPLSEAATIISTKNSECINKPFAYIQVANCTLWTVYGLAISDAFVWLPNVIGLLLGLLQCALLLLYPRDAKAEASPYRDASGVELVEDKESAYPP